MFICFFTKWLQLPRILVLIGMSAGDLNKRYRLCMYLCMYVTGDLEIGKQEGRWNDSDRCVCPANEPWRHAQQNRQRLPLLPVYYRPCRYETA